MHVRATAIGRTTLAGFTVVMFILAPSLVYSIPANSNPMDSGSNWQQLVSSLPTPSAGCFIATYPIVQWIPGGANCVTPPSQPENVGGSGNDFYAYVSSGTIGQAQGYISSASGLTTEDDTSKGSNYYSLQDTTNSYTISAGTYSGYTGEMQFIFINNPGSSSGNVYIQYWLKNYISMPFRPSCPGQGSYLTPWIQNGVNCYANSNVSYSTPLENPSGVLNYQLKGYADNSQGNDESVFCVTGVMCYATAVPYTVLYLSSGWTTSEWNFLGWGAGSGACLNGTPSGGSCPTPSGSPSMTVTQYLYDSTGTNIVTQCSVASTSGTVEYNSLTLGSCTANAVSPYYMYFSMN